jgi:hypothetical protein
MLRLAQQEPLSFHKQSIDFKRAQEIAFTLSNDKPLEYTVEVNGQEQQLNLTSKPNEWHTGYIKIAGASTAMSSLTISLDPTTYSSPYLANVGWASKGKMQ